MAHPGPYQQPMGQQPMQQRPHVIRRGTSRAVPVVVSAGLAVGVFCGLLFGLGTEKVEAQPEASHGTNVKGPHVEEPTLPQSSTVPTKPLATLDAGAVVVTGSGSGSGVANVEPRTAKLTVTLKPDSIAKTAIVTVDGKQMTTETSVVNGNEVTTDSILVDVDQATGKKEVEILVKALGFKDSEQKLVVDGEMRADIELIKSKGAAPVVPAGSTRTTVPTAPPATTTPHSGDGSHRPPTPRKPPKNGSGLIDI